MLYVPRSCVFMVKLAITKVAVYAGDEYTMIGKMVIDTSSFFENHRIHQNQEISS